MKTVVWKRIINEPNTNKNKKKQKKQTQINLFSSSRKLRKFKNHVALWVRISSIFTCKYQIFTLGKCASRKVIWEHSKSPGYCLEVKEAGPQRGSM